MVKAIRITLMLIGLLPHAVALADSANSTDGLHKSSLQAIDTARTSIPPPLPRTRNRFATLDELELQDSSPIGRAKKIRSLSLLTLAEFKKSHLYLGVNKRGLLGLHFNAAKQSGDRCLEVARMPYLQKHNTE
jgi:hypothetical protein